MLIIMKGFLLDRGISPNQNANDRGSAISLRGGDTNLHSICCFPGRPSTNYQPPHPRFSLLHSTRLCHSVSHTVYKLHRLVCLPCKVSSGREGFCYTVEYHVARYKHDQNSVILKTKYLKSSTESCLWKAFPCYLHGDREMDEMTSPVPFTRRVSGPLCSQLFPVSGTSQYCSLIWEEFPTNTQLFGGFF